jgi:hypothetical protein
MGVHRSGGRSASTISAFAWVIAENVTKINAMLRSFTLSYLPKNAPKTYHREGAGKSVVQKTRCSRPQVALGSG